MTAHAALPIISTDPANMAPQGRCKRVGSCFGTDGGQNGMPAGTRRVQSVPISPRWVATATACSLFPGSRNTVLAGHPGLAETATGFHDTIKFSDSAPQFSKDISLAFILIVSSGRNSAYRTTLDACSVTAIVVIKAVTARIAAGSLCRGYFNIGDNAAAAMGYPPFGNKPVAEAEGSETGYIRGMTFGPGGGHADTVIPYRPPHPGKERCSGLGGYKP